MYNLYHKTLLESPLKMDYLFSRGLTIETIKHFRVGLAQSSKVEKAKKNIKLDANGRPYFTNRIMIPLAVDGMFTGRTTLDLPMEFMTPDEVSTKKYLEQQSFVSPKYKHSYPKSEMMMNQKALLKAKETDVAVLVEGHFNVMSLHQGVPSNYIPLGLGGASLGEVQLETLIKSPVKRIILMLDSDKAGVQGTLKIIPMLLKNGFLVKVVVLPKGKDVNDMLVESDDFMSSTINAERKYDATDFFHFYLNSIHKGKYKGTVESAKAIYEKSIAYKKFLKEIK